MQLCMRGSAISEPCLNLSNDGPVTKDIWLEDSSHTEVPKLIAQTGVFKSLVRMPRLNFTMFCYKYQITPQTFKKRKFIGL